MDPHESSRRSFLIRAAAAAAAALFPLRPSCALQEELPPVRAITKGPRFHWFGYYDKLEFDPSSRYVLANEVTFQGRQPKPDDVIKLGMIDLHNDDRWIGRPDAANVQLRRGLQTIQSRQHLVRRFRFESKSCGVHRNTADCTDSGARLLFARRFGGQHQ